jgi:hypothetical protein
MKAPIRGEISSSARSTAARWCRGRRLRNAHLASRVAERHSETAYMTDLALDWIRAQGAAPWVLHLSYVKPHWPYVAPAPFHKMFRKKDVGPIVRGPQDGTAAEHPVVRAYREHDECVSFAREEVARHVRPAYLGLIAQLDYHLGRVLDALDAAGRLSDTLIIFASDHGEFAGDRGLGEKELLYDEIIRVPLIVCDPDPRADASRGMVERRFAECIDVVPTIVDALDAPPAPHRVEGWSLLPLTRGEAQSEWRDAAFAELDYGFRHARRVLRRGVRECRAFMVRTELWKYVHWEGFARSSTTSPLIRVNSPITAPIRAMRPFVHSSTSDCSTGSPRASAGRPLATRRSKSAEMRIAGTASRPASGEMRGAPAELAGLAIVARHRLSCCAKAAAGRCDDRGAVPRRASIGGACADDRTRRR